MKSFKNIAVVCSILLVLASFWVLNPVWIFDGTNARGIVFNTATKVPKKDRMDLAWLLEKELTHDPNTGDVPRERLLAAWQYQQQLLARQGSGKAAIPGVSWTERGPNNCGGRTRTVASRETYFVVRSHHKGNIIKQVISAKTYRHSRN